MSRAHKAFGSQTVDRVSECMSDGVARTAREVAEATGLRDTGISGVMRHLEAKHQAHIVDWPLSRHGKPTARWKFGNGKSAPRPPAKRAIGGNAWRKMHAARSPKTEPTPWHETFKPFRDPMVEAFFGEYRSAA
ncbi:antitermination protein [Paraburkholderia sp. CNPSo 3274]|uniref:antitermination protein n=1 Tax=Paraburkholderia sp. CNPSo 3274 TaxID=2940932 RepID=UPI0020B661A1|nr:antitermination protein [Paraburkholderia sp. CNPSo 3274]MCP3709772.1 antitermination protein [Paraburkholderia sp. CNPSo 3274]